MPLRVLVVIVALASLLGGCVTTSGARDRATLRGWVTAPTPDGPIALDDSGRIRTLAGPRRLLDQLARIPGAYISVLGTSTPTTVRIRDFEIIDAGDGLRPLVGHLIVDQAGVQLEDDVTGTRLALRGPALAELKHEHGARVWVTGTITGYQVLLVAHWGVLVPR